MTQPLQRRTMLALAGTLLLSSGCGFRLRGNFTAPFSTLYLQMRENTRFAAQLTRTIEAGSNVRIVARPEEAEAVFELLDMRRERDVLSINALGRAREYELTLSMQFRVTSPDGFDFVEATTLTTTRDLSYSESEFLSREKEEEILYGDMESDILAQVVRCLEAAKSPES